MRKVLLSIAAFGLMAAFAAPLFAQGDDDGGGGYTPPPPGPPPGAPPNNPPPPPPYNPPPPPPPGGIPGWGGGGGGGGWGGMPPIPPPPPQPPIPSVPPAPPPPPPPAAPPATPPGGGTPGVPATPSTPSTPVPVGSPTTPPPSTGGGTIGGPTTPGTVPPVSTPTVPGTPTGGGTTGTGVLSSKDALKKEAVDRPVGTVHIKMPSSTGGPGTGGGNNTPPGTGNLPPGEVPPGTPPGEDPPTFYGEPLPNNFVLILDASGSMAGSRIASLRAEATATLGGVDDTAQFDVMSYGTQFADSTMELWGGLMPGTDGNKSAAIGFVNGPACNPGGGTPTHRALEKACNIYPDTLNKMFLLTDGAPNATGSASAILAHFPSWWGKFPQETVLVAICIGGVGEAVNFMRDLAAEDDSTGVFINRP